MPRAAWATRAPLGPVDRTEEPVDCTESRARNLNTVAGALICAGICMMGINDRNMKRDFAPVNDEQALEAVLRSTTAGSYKSAPSNARHIGPMAQDFMSTSHVGSNDKTTLQVDGDGVSLAAAIKALSQRVRDVEARKWALEEKLAVVRTRLSRLHRTDENHHSSGEP